MCRAAIARAERKCGRLSTDNKMSYATAHGKLPKVSTQKCVDCGRVAEHYDHRKYSEPLKVEPVCRICNYKRGPATDFLWHMYRELAEARRQRVHQIVNGKKR